VGGDFWVWVAKTRMATRITSRGRDALRRMVPHIFGSVGDVVDGRCQKNSRGSQINAATDTIHVLYRDVSRIAFFLEYMYSKYSVFNLLPIQY
jgi:hypothetical protein